MKKQNVNQTQGESVDDVKDDQPLNMSINENNNMAAHVEDTSGNIGEEKNEGMIESKQQTKSMNLDQILKYQNFVKPQDKDENIKVLSTDESMDRQFYNFLKGMRMEKYLDKFKENDCCDMDSIELFDDDTLKDDIGIKNKIARKKFLKKCRQIKTDMDHFKDNYNIPFVLYERLAKYGIVTVSILCNEVKDKSHLKIKFKIENIDQCDLLWNIIQQHESIKQMEGN